MRNKVGLLLLRSLALLALSAECLVPRASAEPSTPVYWTTFVKVAGQPEVVPDQWLQDEEARYAHNLVLPDAVAKPIPFDFKRARWKAWLPGTPSVALQYFHHLCDTEAGEWILKRADPQSGIYNARPLRQYATAELEDRYALEAPVLQRLWLTKDTIKSGSFFVNPPFVTYEFVEEPRRNVDWQSGIREPYIRLYGYQVERVTEGLKGRPMQMKGVVSPTARYAITWRGTRREKDREHGISGMELIVFDRVSNAVLAVRRQFIVAPMGEGESKVEWSRGRACGRVAYNTPQVERLDRLPLLATPPVVPPNDLPRELKVPKPMLLTHREN